MTDFREFPKIPRLFRDIVITEKIDGTNGAIGISTEQVLSHWQDGTVLGEGVIAHDDNGLQVWIYAQSRSRVIEPGKDNHGFARWVRDNAGTLANDLGPGLHFGEWWGSGIQRGYGLPKGEKRFSLFNTKRWENAEFKTPQLDVVPILWCADFDSSLINAALNELRYTGSIASPGFMNPEGVVVYHTAGNVMFKATIENDGVPKGAR